MMANGMAVASARSYANHLQLILTDNHRPTINSSLNFLHTRCSSWHPKTVSKHCKQFNYAHNLHNYRQTLCFNSINLHNTSTLIFSDVVGFTLLLTKHSYTPASDMVIWDIS